MYTHTQCEHEMTKSTKCTHAFAIHSLIVINKTELNERMVAGHSLEQYEISDRYIKLKWKIHSKHTAIVSSFPKWAVFIRMFSVYCIWLVYFTINFSKRRSASHSERRMYSLAKQTQTINRRTGKKRVIKKWFLRRKTKKIMLALEHTHISLANGAKWLKRYGIRLLFACKCTAQCQTIQVEICVNIPITQIGNL